MTRTSILDIASTETRRIPAGAKFSAERCRKRLMALGMALGLLCASSWAQAKPERAALDAPKPVATATVPREATPMAEDPQLEARLVELSQELRCMVCQNESLASSHAELAEDLRREVRDLLREGKSNQAVKDFLVARYGDFVLYRPEVKPLTWVLWFGPFLLFLIAAVALALYLRQRRRLTAPAALSDEARARAQRLLKD